MADRLISVPAAKAYIEVTVGDQILKGCMNNVLDSLPAVDAVKVVHGRWIEDDENARRYCSHCGFSIHDDASYELYGDDQVKPKHCPECGAKMDLGGDR